MRQIDLHIYKLTPLIDVGKSIKHGKPVGLTVHNPDTRSADRHALMIGQGCEVMRLYPSEEIVSPEIRG